MYKFHKVQILNRCWRIAVTLALLREAFMLAKADNLLMTRWMDNYPHQKCPKLQNVVHQLRLQMQPKYHLFQQSSLGLNTYALCSWAYPQNLRAEMAYSSLDLCVYVVVTPHKSSPAVKKRNTISRFFISFCLLSKKENRNKKKTLTLSTSQTRIINILLWTILPWTEWTPHPSLPWSKLLYTLFFTSLYFLFSLFHCTSLSK